jgi:hypothetical protein
MICQIDQFGWDPTDGNQKTTARQHITGTGRLSVASDADERSHRCVAALILNIGILGAGLLPKKLKVGDTIAIGV